MQNNSLKNKKIVISAGASGIGLAITKTCLERGAAVLVTDINNKFINKLKKNSKYKKKLFLYNFDASDENDVSNFFKSVKLKFNLKFELKMFKVCLSFSISILIFFIILM